MRPASARRSGYLLVHVIAVLPLAALLMLILGKLVIDTLYLQRVAAQHANIVAVGDSLARHLREDTWAALDYGLDGNAFALQTVSPAGRDSVTYTFDKETVRRRTSDGDEAWACTRLRFEWQVESGPRGDVLWLALREIPPARATAVLPRSFTLTFLLPRPAERQP